MANARYSVLADAFALSSSFKTLALIIPGAILPVTIVEFGVSVDAASGRCYVELVESTQAGAGSNTNTGAKQTGGFTGTDTVGPNSTYGREYASEPTTLTALKTWIFAAPGPLVIQFPLGREPQSLNSAASKYKAIGIRAKVDTGTPNCEAYLEWEE